jgi:hypothetical protein
LPLVYKFSLVFFSLVVFFLSPAFGQQEDDSYQRELSYGVNFNTNGGLIGGGMIKSTHRLRDKWYHFGAIEIVEVKHPKEQVRFNQETGGTYVVGKSNYLFSIRPQYGREHVLFKKAPESGVQVNAIFAAGPTLGLVVPYLINYNYGANRTPPVSDVRTEQYNPKTHRDQDIMGRAGVFRGLSQNDLKLGANFKSAVSFEYGRYREGVTGVETGLLVEMFPTRPIIIPEATNRNVFTSLYLTLYYGRRK